ncbi:MAG: hypothetical protein VX043_02550, partial [Candidatus Thermoplasmatota archaeon]|nr:hypothetical protein [Candidatus Thermoplasmatota archaeon]
YHPDEIQSPKPNAVLPHLIAARPKNNGIIATINPIQYIILMCKTRWVNFGDSGIGSGCCGNAVLKPLPLVIRIIGSLGNKKEINKPVEK